MIERAAGTRRARGSPLRTGALALALAACGSTGAPRPGEKIVAAELPAAQPLAKQAFERAQQHMARGPAHYDKAVAELQKAVEQDGKLYEGWHNLGFIALRQGRFLDAVAAFERALRIQPAARASLVGLAQAHMAAGNPDRAHALYADWLRADPEDVELRLAYIAALREGGKAKAALEEVRALLFRDSHSALAFNALGLVHRKLGNLGLAETAFRRALELDAKAAYVWNNLGLLALDRKDDQEAFACFSKALELAPKYVEALINRAAVYLDCGAYDKAEVELKRALELRPSDPDLHVALGVAARGRGKLALAIEHYEKALEIQPDYPPALYNLGVLFMDHREDKKRAREALLLYRKVAAGDQARRNDAELRLKMLQ